MDPERLKKKIEERIREDRRRDLATVGYLRKTTIGRRNAFRLVMLWLKEEETREEYGRNVLGQRLFRDPALPPAKEKGKEEASQDPDVEVRPKTKQEKST